MSNRGLFIIVIVLLIGIISIFAVQNMQEAGTALPFKGAETDIQQA